MEGSSANTADKEFFQTKRRRVLGDGDDVEDAEVFCRQKSDPAGHVWLSIFSLPLLSVSVRHTAAKKTRTSNLRNNREKFMVRNVGQNGLKSFVGSSLKFQCFFFVDVTVTLNQPWKSCWNHGA